MLKDRYTVLELLNLRDPTTDYQCYCVVEGTQMPAQELSTVSHYQHLHNKLLENIRSQNKTVANELCRTLHGRWGGKLDSFYEAVIEHFKH